MKYNQLPSNKTASKKRVGRGISAGQGKTAGRGTKGQNARANGKTRPGFEGGQNPLMQRLPKLRGFRSIRPKAEVVYTGQLDNISGKVDNFTLYESNLVSSPYVKAKIVVNGDINKKHEVYLQAASKSAIEMIQKAGGSFNQTPRVKRTPKDKKDNK